MSAEHAGDVAELRSRGVVKLKGDDSYALWLKTACGQLSARQLHKLADVADAYGKGIILFTTRQIPMIPFVRLGDVPRAQTELNREDVTLDRCGPTVRNVNVCYDDVTCPEALANSLSLGEKLDHFFHVAMTHKVKLGVAGCAKDCDMVRVLTDIGFIAAESGGRVGYDVYVGGRLGLKSSIGQRVAEGLVEEQCVRLVQNYFHLMNTQGKKDERAADLMTRLGYLPVRQALHLDLDSASGVAPIRCPARAAPTESATSIIRVRANSGEVTSAQLRRIADMAAEYGRGFVHFAVRGGPEIPGVRASDVGAANTALQAAGLEPLGDGLANLQSCFGGYCTEGNTDPQSLLRRVEALAREKGLDKQRVTVSGSGCPNACGIPALSDIGFHGAVEPRVEAASCNGCGICVPVCKRRAIELRDGVAVLNADECRHCGVCITVCPFGGMVEGRRGFALSVGGRGDGDTRLGRVIANFLSEDEALQAAEVCLRVIQSHGTDAAAVIDRHGIGVFKDALAARAASQEHAR